MSYFAQLWDRREFAWQLALADLKARNASTFLGLAWWVLNPLLLAGVYFFVFGFVFGSAERGSIEYLSHLMSGIFVFYYTRNAMTRGAAAIISNRGLIVNIRFPRLLLPIASIIESSIGFAVSLGVFFALVLAFSGPLPGVQILLLVPIVALQTVFNIGVAALVARLAVPYRDINNVLPYLLRIWLYVSPIIWTAELLENLPEAAQTLVRVNPMYSLLNVYRAALLGSPLDAQALAAFTAWAFVVLVVGVASFVRYEGRMVHYV